MIVVTHSQWINFMKQQQCFSLSSFLCSQCIFVNVDVFLLSLLNNKKKKKLKENDSRSKYGKISRNQCNQRLKRDEEEEKKNIQKRTKIEFSHLKNESNETKTRRRKKRIRLKQKMYCM